MPSLQLMLSLLLTPEKSGFSNICFTYKEQNFIKLKQLFKKILMNKKVAGAMAQDTSSIYPLT